MAGYDGYSMSNNARDAYERGLVPASKITKALLEKHNIKESVGFIKWMIKEGHLVADEWHHSSKHYNRTNFYDLKILAEELEADDISGCMQVPSELRNEYELNNKLKKYKCDCGCANIKQEIRLIGNNITCCYCERVFESDK